MEVDYFVLASHTLYGLEHKFLSLFVYKSFSFPESIVDILDERKPSYHIERNLKRNIERIRKKIRKEEQASSQEDNSIIGQISPLHLLSGSIPSVKK